MARVHEFKAAKTAAEPIIIRFDDGREYEFPGDIQGSDWLAFLNEFGAEDDGNDELLNAKIMEPLLVMLCGQEMFERIISECSLTEVAQITSALWGEYMGLVAGVSDEDDGGGSGEA